MHDIDAHIKRISGQQNYMEQIAKITGNIEFVDKDIWKYRHKQVCIADNNIRKLMKNIAENENSKTDFHSVINELEDLQNKLQLKEKAFKSYTKGILNDGYKPIDLAKSAWFACIRKIEKNINDYIADVIGNFTKEDSSIRSNIISKEAENIEKSATINSIAISAIYAKNPELKDLKYIMGIKVSDINSKQFMMIHQFAKFIINTFLNPMYDVKSKIQKNEKQLYAILKHDVAKNLSKTNVMHIETVKKALESFVIAKFRTEITGSAEHFMKLFFNVIGDEDMSNMDGARFMEMMDSLNIESLSSERQAYHFATKAKDMIRKVSTGEKLNADEIVTEFKSLFENKVEEIPETTKDFSNDLL